MIADDRADTPHPYRAPMLALMLLAAMAGFGARAARDARRPNSSTACGCASCSRTLQQDAKFNYGAKAEVMARYLSLSDRVTGPQSKGVHDATILIWPEAAFPFFLTREPDALAQIAGLLNPGTELGHRRGARRPRLAERAHARL